MTRRSFVFLSAAGVSGGPGVLGRTPSLKRLGYNSPNEKLNIAAIGAGGRGWNDVIGCAETENIVAFGDPDWKQAAKTFDRFPNVPRYKDFRRMLDKEKSIDAVTVSTPDHVHAVAAMAADGASSV